MWWGCAIEAPDPDELASFYSQLLGWPISHQEPGTAILAAAEGSTYIVFQQATGYRAPVWPPVGEGQRPMMHLDFQVGDLDSAVTEAIALGARVAGHKRKRTSGCSSIRPGTRSASAETTTNRRNLPRRSL